MKVIKYYCDICKKEVEKEEDFFKVPYFNKPWNYYNSDEISIVEKEICINCLESLSNSLDEISENNKNN